MRIECVQEKLKWSVSIAEKISGKHMTLPVLSCLFFEASKNNTITIKSTNLDLGIEIIISAKVEEEGTVAIPSATLSSFVNGLSDSEKSVKMVLDQGNLKINTPKAINVEIRIIALTCHIPS